MRNQSSHFDMEYGSFDNSGTDDELPSSYQIPRGTRAAGAAGGPTGSNSYSRMQSEMETRIHYLEKEAYSSVLRAFKAQADAITWDKEGLITELRKELRVSDDEHRELLSQVNADGVIRRIREWRQSGSYENTVLGSSALQDPMYGSSISASRKRLKPTPSVPLLPLAVPPSALRHQSAAASPRPSFSSRKKRVTPRARGRSSGYNSRLPARSQSFSHRSSGAPVASDPFVPAGSDPLIGRKVLTRWPEENYFYEAVISDFNPLEGRHALVYDKGTPTESWEWVNLKEIPPEDIRWEGEDPAVPHAVDHSELGRGLLKFAFTGGSGSGAGIGCRSFKGDSKNELPPSREGVVEKNPDEIEIFHTETLLKEVEKILEYPNPTEIVKAKSILKEQEQALVDLIAKLGYVSDGESAEEQQPVLNQPLTGTEQCSNQHTDQLGSGNAPEIAGTDVIPVLNGDGDAEKQKDDIPVT